MLGSIVAGLTRFKLSAYKFSEIPKWYNDLQMALGLPGLHLFDSSSLFKMLFDYEAARNAGFFDLFAKGLKSMNPDALAQYMTKNKITPEEYAEFMKMIIDFYNKYQGGI